MCDVSRVVSKDAVGAPEHEVEITPAMVMAGVREFSAFDPRFEDGDDLVRLWRSNRCGECKCD